MENYSHIKLCKNCFISRDYSRNELKPLSKLKLKNYVCIANKGKIALYVSKEGESLLNGRNSLEKKLNLY